MSCDVYYYRNISIRFDVNRDNVPCLCTFPHNDGDKLDIYRVRSLAMLGAAVKLIHEHNIISSRDIYLPTSLPQWIVNEINRLLPEEDSGDEL